MAILFALHAISLQQTWSSARSQIVEAYSQDVDLHDQEYMDRAGIKDGTDGPRTHHIVVVSSFEIAGERCQQRAIAVASLDPQVNKTQCREGSHDNGEGVGGVDEGEWASRKIKCRESAVAFTQILS